MMLKKIDTIIWDWNGTLLNDVDICIRGINQLLQRRGLSALEKHRYLQIFTFPVKDYYAAAGFDFSREAFEIPAEEFIIEYNLLLPQVVLFPDVRETLEYFNNKGFRQFIVSAMEQQALYDSVKSQHIYHFFEQICGIDNNLAYSKVNRGRELINLHTINPATSLFIGDTLHDLEVGTQLGMPVALISRGHQCHSRLKVNGNMVFNDFTGLLSFLENSCSQQP